MSEQESLPKHRVALVVFATVEAADAHDAEYVLERMLREKIGFDADRQMTMEFSASGITWRASVVRMMGAGMALLNGYMGAYPTGRGWREYGKEDPGPVELR